MGDKPHLSSFSPGARERLCVAGNCPQSGTGVTRSPTPRCPLPLELCPAPQPRLARLVPSSLPAAQRFCSVKHRGGRLVAG